MQKKYERENNVSIQVKNGDVLQADVNIIVHQVNCMGVMGSGIAKQNRDKYPKVYEEYAEKCHKIGRYKSLMLGDVLYTQIAPDKFVASVFGQLNYGWVRQYTNISALRMGLLNLKTYAEQNNYSIAFPYGIGCGREGADWAIVSKIIKDIFYEMDVEIWKL